MGKKADLENELAELSAQLEGAENDDIRAELQNKIDALQTDLENATDEEELEEVADDLERLQEWARNELGVPLSEMRTEMAEIKTLLEKLDRKMKAAKVEPTQQPPLQQPQEPPEPDPLPPPSEPPAPPPLPEKPTRQITRL